MAWAFSFRRSTYVVVFVVAFVIIAAGLSVQQSMIQHGHDMKRIHALEHERRALEAEARAAVTVVDVSRAAVAQGGEGSIALLIGVAPDESVVAPDDVSERWAGAEAGDYLDVELANVTTGARRRVLVLVH
jgi:hypothetical protein